MDGATFKGDAVIPDTVTDICKYAFEDCTGLTSVKIPDGVYWIYDWAFMGCTSLKNITVPKSVDFIGDLAFGFYKDEDWNNIMVEGFKIYCYKNTTGERYAINNGFNYELIKEPGDADGSGNVNMKDYVLFQRHLNSWAVDIDLTVLDLNGDGKVNMKDLVLLQRYLNGWNVEFA